MKHVTIPKDRPVNLVKARLLAPFSSKYRNRVGLTEIDEPLHLVYRHCVMTPDARFLFVKNPKAGCSSVAQLLHKYATGEFSEGDIHAVRRGIYQGINDWKKFHAYMNQADTTLFTFVRNPESRLVSGFFDFCVGETRNRAYKRHRSAMRARGYDEDRNADWNLHVFVEYVHESMRQDRFLCDEHWREQHLNIGYSFMNYDYVGRLENYKDDIETVFDMSGRGAFLDDNMLTQKFNDSRTMNLEIHKSLRSRIEELYKEDYELFGY